MIVRAKFSVTSITQVPNWDKNKHPIFTIKLAPVMGDSPENKMFYEATPAGAIELQTVNYNAGSQFIAGAEYYIDFVPVTPQIVAS